LDVTRESDADWDGLLGGEARGNARLYFRLAYAVLRDASLAEDVCQQSFLRAWEHRGTLADAASLRAWLSRTVVNGAITLVRRDRALLRALAARTAVAALATGKGAGRQAELREAVVAALTRLPATIQAVVTLRVMHGMSGNDVCDLMGCSPATVSRQLHEGLERLRELLSDWQHESVEA
jgi:RNA polymerase sigma-70 factor (ECF subfamily)